MKTYTFVAVAAFILNIQHYTVYLNHILQYVLQSFNANMLVGGLRYTVNVKGLLFCSLDKLYQKSTMFYSNCHTSSLTTMPLTTTGFPQPQTVELIRSVLISCCMSSIAVSYS